MNKILLSLITAMMFISCAKEKDDSSSSEGFKTGVPAVDPIVRDASPSALTSVSALALRALQNYRGALDKSSPVGDETTLKTWLTTTVFNKCTTTNCNGSTYYRYWTAVIDDKVKELETRFTVVPDCVSQTPTAISFPNPMSTGTIDIHLSCNDSGDGSSSLPPGVSAQNMYFGIKDSVVYIFNLTSYTDGSKRALIAEASATGDDVKIWNLSKGTNGADDSVGIFNKSGC